MGTNIKILQDDNVIFDEELEDVDFNISRKITPQYRTGETEPFDIIPSAVNKVTLTGKFLKKPDGTFTMEE